MWQVRMQWKLQNNSTCQQTTNRLGLEWSLSRSSGGGCFFVKKSPESTRGGATLPSRRNVEFESPRVKDKGGRSYKKAFDIIQVNMSSSGFTIHLSKFLGQSILKRCRQMTGQMFHKYLLITNVGISASLSLTGDIIQQHYEIIQDKGRNWDKARTFRMTVAGIAVGTICHYWYQYLDKKLPGRTLKVVLKKVAVDQLVCSPLYITVFFVMTCAMEKATLEEFKSEMVHKWWRLYLAEWVIWPPAQVINFYLLPPRFRVLYDNVISLGYDIYTSYVKNEIPLNVENDQKLNEGSEKR